MSAGIVSSQCDPRHIGSLVKIRSSKIFPTFFLALTISVWEEMFGKNLAWVLPHSFFVCPVSAGARQRIGEARQSKSQSKSKITSRSRNWNKGKARQGKARQGKAKQRQQTKRKNNNEQRGQTQPGILKSRTWIALKFLGVEEGVGGEKKMEKTDSS